MEIREGFEAALTAATEHALDKKNQKTSHLGCALYVDGQLTVVTDNTKDMHAEMDALHLYNLTLNTDAAGYYRERDNYLLQSATY